MIQKVTRSLRVRSIIRDGVLAYASMHYHDIINFPTVGGGASQ
jgi:hypothetical protein